MTPRGDEVPDDLPHDPPTARVEPGRRLVEEDDPRIADEGHRQVEAAAHAAGERRDGLLRRLDEVEPLEQLGGPPPAFALAEMEQIRHQDEVLLAGEEAVHRRELAGDADRGPDRFGLAPDVVAGDLDLAAVGGDQRRQDMDRRRLAGAVRAEQGEDRPGPDLEVDAVEDELLAV